MSNVGCSRLQSILSQFSRIHQFLDDAFVKAQCESGLSNYLLSRLVNDDSSGSTAQHLPTLEKRLAKLASVAGYDRLGSLLRGASNWDQYQEALAQIDITLWFNQKNLLKEIEPLLPHGLGNADILLSFAGQDIYCEVASFQSIIKSIEAKAKDKENKIREQWKEQRGSIKIKGVARNLLDKTKRQLPQDYPAILALNTTKSAIFAHDVRLIANRLLPRRPQVALIGLWSWEGDGEAMSWDNSPTSFFVNHGSKFYKVGKALIQSLNVKSEIVGC